MNDDQRLLDLRAKYRQDNSLDYLPAVIGDSIGNVYDPNIPGNIFVRQKTSNGLSAPRSVKPPTNSAISLLPGVNVELSYDKRGQLFVSHIDTAQTAATTGNPLTGIQPPPVQPARISQSSLSTLQIVPTQPTASLTVVIKSWNPIISTTAYQFAGASQDMTASLPSAGNMRYVMLAIENDYATVRIVTSTARSVTDLPLGIADIQECITALSAGDTPVYALKLIGGQTQITQSDIDNDGVDMRQLVNNGAVISGLAGLSVTAPIVNLGTAINPNIGLSTPLALNYGGTHVDLSATGGAHFVAMQESIGANFTVRALVSADIPALAYVTSITAGTGLTGGVITTSGTIALSVPVSVANGGTGLTASGSPKNALFSNGSIWTSRVIDADDVQTGVFANARVNWAAPGTLGSTTPNTVSATNVTITGGGYIRPSADSTAAILIQTSTGTGIVALDSTNIRVGINKTLPIATLDVGGGLNVGLSGTNLNMTFPNSTSGFISSITTTYASNVFDIIGMGRKLRFTQNDTTIGSGDGDRLLVSLGSHNIVLTTTNVGIGISSSFGGKFHVVGGSSQIASVFQSGSGSSNITEWWVQTGTIAGSISSKGVATFTPITTATSGITNALTIGSYLTTINAGTAGIGVDLIFNVADSAAAIGTGVQAARIRALLPIATHASRTGQSIWSVSDSTGERDVIGIGANGSASTLGFFNVTQVVQQPAATALGLTLSNYGLRAAGAPALELLSAYNGDTLAGNGLADIVWRVHLTGQTAAIADTTMWTPPTDGQYEIDLILTDTTTGISGTMTSTITWTDYNGTQTFASPALNVASVGEVDLTKTIYAKTSGAIKYRVDLTSILGSPQFSIDIIVIRLA